MPRPIPTWHGFVGQRDIVASLAEHARGAVQKAVTLPHVLLSGQSGVGKTHLARAVSADMQTGFHDHCCDRQTKKIDVAEKLAAVKKGDIVFLDEIHALPADGQEMLYVAIDGLRVPKIDAEKRRLVPNQWTSIPAFTLILATDQPGRLLKALRQRFDPCYTLAEYTIPELQQIVFNTAAEINILLTPQAATRLAEAARGIPRLARNRMKSFRVSMPDTSVEITRGMVDRYLRSIGIDDENLTRNDIRYLRELLKRGGRLSLANLAVLLGADIRQVQAEIEGYLHHRGWIGIDSRGRFMTPGGVKFCAERGIA